MTHLQFGRSGLYVSRLSYGTWRLEKTPDDQVEPLINEVIDSGINLLDTAPGYGQGRSEELVGRAIRNRGGRDQVLIATKCSAPNPRAPNGFMTTRRSIVAHCEASLKRLGLDYIDLYQIHCVERFVPIDETLSALSDLVHAGKVRYIGASNYKGWQLVEACWASEKHHFQKFVSDQSEYHLFDRRLERENFPAMQTYGMAALIYSPLKTGVLSCELYGGIQAVANNPKYAWLKEKPDHVYLSQPIQTAMGKLVALAKQAGETPSQMALAFVMKHPVTAIPIIAPRTREQLHDSLGACDIVVDEAMSKAFDAIVAPGDKILGLGFNAYNHGPTARWY